MRENKFLRAISYILVPIFVLIICISLFYLSYKEELTIDNEIDSSFFESDEFLQVYMSKLSREAQYLIFYNERTSSIMDGYFKICYKNNEEYYNIKDFYYIILYKNIALTNVELTTETNTVEKIKNYIFNLNNKNVKIINGNVEAYSEIISTKAIKYFDQFENTYYSVVDSNQNTVNYMKASSSEEVEEAEIGILETNTNSKSKTKEFHTTSIQDFEIYSSYAEEVIVRNEDVFLKNLAYIFVPYESVFIYCIPVCSIFVVIILIYLIISIGHTKGKEGIDLNDFDKIPIEIILIAGSIFVTLAIACIGGALNFMTEEYFKFILSCVITGYFITYILCAAMVVTIIKRIKAKTLFKDSVTGKIWRFCLNIIKNIIEKCKKFLKELTKNWNISSKLILGIFIYCISVIILIIVLQGLGFLIALGGSIYILYKVIEKINCYKKIENHLKEMYEGDNSTKLASYDFTPEFQDIIKYINDISSGFENAIQEGIKSERLKTELITNVSHDIKTPLTSIINYVDLLKKENIENEKIKEYIDILDNKSQRLKKLTEDLVEASKASSGNVKLNIEKINICELIKQTTGEFEDKFKNKNLEIITNMTEKNIYIDADNKYMYRIIENLFGNISKYALDSSRVYLDINKKDSKVKIEVKNISKERLNISADELMQRFVRGDKSRTTEGSGLGLSISKSLTELQKGKFELKVDGDLFKVELEFDISK